MPDIYEELLSPAGMASARNAVINAYRGRWFFHKSPERNFASIKALGLQPHYPGGVVPDLVRRRLGCRAPLIVCLWPQSSLAMNLDKGDEGKDFVCLAISVTDLPFQIGLDWSHLTWAMAGTRKTGNPNWDTNKVFLNVVDGTGSIVSYDAISASQLRICSINNSRTDPVQWPLISKVTRADVALH
jgi:hypothetical protein